VNFDVPNLPETYVHRIGRTARAGAEGVAISLCDGDELAYIRDIEKLIRAAIPVSDRRTGHPQAAARATKAENPRGAPGGGTPRRRRRGGASGKQWRGDRRPESSAELGSVAFLNRPAPSRRDARGKQPGWASQSKGT
jgi:ATP-dependent RNA helicase RhlE